MRNFSIVTNISARHARCGLAGISALLLAAVGMAPVSALAQSQAVAASPRVPVTAAPLETGTLPAQISGLAMINGPGVLRLGADERGFGGRDVRLHGITAPVEAVGRHDSVYALLERLIDGQEVQCLIVGRDIDGLPLGACETDNTPNLALALLDAGRVMVNQEQVQNTPVATLYNAAERNARRLGIGLWGPVTGPIPSVSHGGTRAAAFLEGPALTDSAAFSTESRSSARMASLDPPPPKPAIEPYIPGLGNTGQNRAFIEKIGQLMEDPPRGLSVSGQGPVFARAAVAGQAPQRLPGFGSLGLAEVSLSGGPSPTEAQTRQSAAPDQGIAAIADETAFSTERIMGALSGALAAHHERVALGVDGPPRPPGSEQSGLFANEFIWLWGVLIGAAIFAVAAFGALYAFRLMDRRLDDVKSRLAGEGWLERRRRATRFVEALEDEAMRLAGLFDERTDMARLSARHPSGNTVNELNLLRVAVPVLIKEHWDVAGVMSRRLGLGARRLLAEMTDLNDEIAMMRDQAQIGRLHRSREDLFTELAERFEALASSARSLNKTTKSALALRDQGRDQGHGIGGWAATSPGMLSAGVPGAGHRLPKGLRLRAAHSQQRTGSSGYSDGIEYA